MRIKNYKRDFIAEQRICDEKLKMKITCSNCGRKVSFYAFEKEDKKCCDWCGHYVFKDKKAKFKYELKTTMIKKKREERN